jgi:hypothetical protein
MDGNAVTWIVVGLLALALVVAIAVIVTERRNRKRLQDRFGPEYDRTVERAGGKRQAEQDLAERADRRDELELRPLSGVARDRFLAEWDRVQAGFVDQPRVAVDDADRLISRLMRERGYPEVDGDERADLLSVDHPHTVERYRTGLGLHRRDGADPASTEDLRRAMVHYRSLFVEMLDAGRDGGRTVDLREQELAQREHATDLRGRS